MNQALKTHTREEDVELRLESLRLKEAYLMLREGDTETELQALSSEAASKQALNTLRGEVWTLHEDHVQVASQCKRALSGQEAMLRRLEEHSQKTQAEVLKLNRTEISLQATLYHLHEETLPTFIYSYKCDSEELHRTSLVTGDDSFHEVPSYTFKYACCWSEVPGGSLLITGGGEPAVREVMRFDTRREFAAVHCAPMLTPRREHAAVYHTPHLYVLGGWTDSRSIKVCERYVCSENRWEALPPLPIACINSSGVVLENSLYALGGRTAGFDLDFVQKFSLESLTWELMQFRLPHAGNAIPCFKLRDTEVYLVVNKTLCSFTALQVRPLKTLTEKIRSRYGASFYRRGTLYCSKLYGPACSFEIGSLSI
jgi:hypothetical protein